MPNDRKNIELCLASPVLYPPRGGAEIRFTSYLSGLGKRGINVRLLTGTPKAKKITDQDKARDWFRAPPGSLITNEPLNGVPVDQVRLPDRSGWKRVTIFNRALLNHCRLAQPRPDIVQLIEPLSPLALPWLYRLKTLGVARSFAYTLPYELPAKGFRKVLRQNALRLLYSQLDCVITGSEATRAHAFSLGLRTRTEVIPNGVNLQRFKPVTKEEKKNLRASLGLGGVARMITSVGSIIPRKGTDLLLESWAVLARRFPDLHFVLVGPRTDESDPKLRAFHEKLVGLVNRSGAADQVHFTGRVENVESYLQASDMFVFASEREGMANVVLEAMASGVPVVLTPHIGLPPDFGEPSHQYLLAERHSESFAAAVSALLDDEKRHNDLAQNGRKWVERSMDLDSVLDHYADLYHELAKQP